MSKVNFQILNSLEKAASSLSNEAFELVRSFILSKIDADGGFVDRSGKADPYYTVFGLTLAYVFDIKPDIKAFTHFLNDWQNKNKVDFVHAISIVRCNYLLEAIKYAGNLGALSRFVSKMSFSRKDISKVIGKRIAVKQKQVLNLLNDYKVKSGGYNHLKKNEESASVYANFLIYGMFEDLNINKPENKLLAESILELQLFNGSFVNHPGSKQGIASNTAAGIILLFENGYPVDNSTNWLKDQIGPAGGFFAGEEVPVADILSTATSLLALSLTGTATDKIISQAINFVNLHWDESGGFFGSVADQIPDVEYTFYALLAVGLLK